MPWSDNLQPCSAKKSWRLRKAETISSKEEIVTPLTADSFSIYVRKSLGTSTAIVLSGRHVGSIFISKPLSRVLI